MPELVEFNAGQAEQMRFLEETWPEYGHSLQVAAAFSGGMGWKTVRGVEYLVRYHSEEGKKKFTSYGRRSPKTEEIHWRWEETTGRARRVVKERKDEVALACRLAKAHGIARLPGRHAEMLERCWYLDVTKRLSLFGGTALLAYEGRAGALAPAPLVKEDRLHFVARVDPDDLGLDEIVDVVCDVDGSGCAAKRGRDRISIATTDGEPRAEIYLPGYFMRRAEGDYQAEAYALAIEVPRWNGLTVARDGRPVAVTALDPASYVALSMGGGDLWTDRSEIAVRMKVRIDRNLPEAEAPDERRTMRGP
jgi:hypothetical protein